MSETPLVIPPRGGDAVRSAPTLAAGFVTVVAFALLGGPAGAAVALVPAVALVVGGPLLAFLAGTIAVMGVYESLGMAPLPAHLVLTTFLLAALSIEYDRAVGVLYLTVVTAYVGLFFLTRSTVGGLAETAAVLVAAAALVSYVIHRYELLTLGLIDE